MVTKNKMRSIRFLIVGAIATLSFTYGALVGRYHWFPFNQLSAAKSVVSKSALATRVPQNRDGRRVNHLNRIAIYDSYKTQADVAMIGDSITDFAEWAEMFPEVSIVNRGIAGDTAVGVLERLDSVLATGAKSAFIMIGVNDISEGASAEEVFAVYARILDKLLDAGVRPYVQSTLMLGEQRKRWNPTIVELNDMLKREAERKNLFYIDLNLSVASGGVLDERYTNDGIHLNAAGYRIWREKIGPIVSSAGMTTLSRRRPL
jgi:lysophospholipase L1-like esterase